jgi:nucleoside-diphosphate-sugar epimerase
VLSGEKILVTGAAGIIGLPLAEWLAKDNEVWGLARFSAPTALAEVESAGVIPYRSDLERGDFSDLPADFTYLFHLAALSSGSDYDRSIAVNAEGTGLLLHHCCRVKAALVMSTHSVYKPQEDPRHAFAEKDPLGDANPSISPAYSVSKIAQEAVARYCARAFELPIVIARMNISYGPRGGLPITHMEAIATGKPVITKWDPCLYSPIYVDDINEQADALLDAASVPATIVNWGGDEAVSVQEWAVHMAELTRRPAQVVVEEVPGTSRGLVADVTKRRSITGPCKVGWREGLTRTFERRYGDRTMDQA